MSRRTNRPLVKEILYGQEKKTPPTDVNRKKEETKDEDAGIVIRNIGSCSASSLYTNSLIRAINEFCDCIKFGLEKTRSKNSLEEWFDKWLKSNPSVEDIKRLKDAYTDLKSKIGSDLASYHELINYIEPKIENLGIN